MRSNMIKLALSLVGVLIFGTAQADPISGQINISGNTFGNFQVCTSSSFASCTPATSGTSAADINGFIYGTGGNQGTVYSNGGTNPTDNILAMMTAAGDTFPFTPVQLSSIDLYGISVPPGVLEWSIAPVQVGTGSNTANGTLEFWVTSGHADALSSGFDLEGSGYFHVNCGTNSLCSAYNQYVDTKGGWTISNSGGGTNVTLYNVPAPATIGILGIALLGLGFYRRRSASAS